MAYRSKEVVKKELAELRARLEKQLATARFMQEGVTSPFMLRLFGDRERFVEAQISELESEGGGDV